MERFRIQHRRKRTAGPRRWSSARRLASAMLALPLVVAAAQPAAAAEPLRIGYSDWPGWVAWQIAIEKGWLRDAGVDARFEWSEYSASIDAFEKGELDADMVTNGDALLMGGAGAPNAMILITDYSNGNDVIVGRSDVGSMADLQGRKVGVEVGLVEHLLLVDGLRKARVPEKDVDLVDTKTNAAPDLLRSGAVAAVGAWQPIAGRAMGEVAGSHPLYTSAEQPGLIYDAIAVSPRSLAARRDEWTRLVALWDRVVGYIADPATQADALAIMARRVGVATSAYARILKGTRLLSLAEGRRAMVKRPGFGSLYGSTQNANAFNLRANAYKVGAVVDDYIDDSFTKDALRPAAR